MHLHIYIYLSIYIYIGVDWRIFVWLQEAIPLPDQIDEAVNYIKSLQAKLEKSKKNKETLSGTRKRPHTCTNESNISTLKSPKIEIHEMGRALNVTLVTGHDDKFIFHEIIRLIHEEGVEVLSANFSVIGNSIFHAIHAKVSLHSFD